METQNPDFQQGVSVPQRKRWTNINENGTKVESFAPFPVAQSPVIKHYYSPVSMTAFIREDGVKLNFLHHHFETGMIYDQEYLDHEIANGNPYVRLATEAEIEQADMRRDPRGTIAKSVREQLKEDPAFKAELEAEILARLEASGRLIPDSEKLAGSGGQDGSSTKQSVKQEATGPIVKVSQDPATSGMLGRLGGIKSSADVTKAAASSGI